MIVGLIRGGVTAGGGMGIVVKKMTGDAGGILQSMPAGYGVGDQTWVLVGVGTGPMLMTSPVGRVTLSQYQ